MGRKKHYIVSYNSKDEKFFQALRCTGYLDHSRARQFLSENRLKNMGFEKIIEKCSYLNPRTKKEEEVYRFTDKGKSFCQQEYGLRNFYRSSSPEHDLKVADKYLSLSEQERQTWKTEGDNRDRWKEYMTELKEENIVKWDELEQKYKNHEISMPDCSYTSGGIEICYEVKTNNYGIEEIEAKQIFADEMNLKIQFV